MEAVGTTVGVVSLIPQLLDLVQRVSTAISSFEDTPKSLATMSDDLNSLKLVLELINDKPVLQTDGVKYALAGLVKVAEETRRQVNDITDRTSDDAVPIHIQVIVVGLCEVSPQGSTNCVPAINSIVVNEVNQEVEKKLGTGLRIADIVKGKVPDG
ncbi:hypothetical protein NM208_g9804 [Fusarium decemcellulare]|uniref:Uncharacterized protein n=1 Tax=Fusarium decemcellulare TaxID=57161 RepID=A0ACC1S064_9HYPO|nr:hypothetical protein NM208_g9804 [Fusarium decemcellulare]